MATRAQFSNMKNEKKTTKKPIKSIEDLRTRHKELMNKEKYDRGREKYDSGKKSY